MRLKGEWPSTRVVGTRTQSPSKHLANEGSMNFCYKIRSGSSPKIHLAPGTVHNYWRICQTHQSWESGLKCWTHMNYIRRLNVLPYLVERIFAPITQNPLPPSFLLAPLPPTVGFTYFHKVKKECLLCR